MNEYVKNIYLAYLTYPSHRRVTIKHDDYHYEIVYATHREKCYCHVYIGWFNPVTTTLEYGQLADNDIVWNPKLNGCTC